MKKNIIDFLRFTGLNTNLGWITDYLFWIALFISLPVRVFLLPRFASHTDINLHFLIFRLFLVAFAEELFFRGFLMGFLNDYLKGKMLFLSYSNITAAIIFSLFHLFSHSFVWSFLVFIPALVFGYFRDKFDSIFPSVILHFVYNAVYFCL